MQTFDAAAVAGGSAARRGLADERVLRADARGQEPGQIQGEQSGQRKLPVGQQRDAKGAHRAGIRGDDHVAAGLPGDRRGKGVRRERHALAKDDLAHGAVALHAMQVILDDRVVEAGDDCALVDAGGHRVVDDFGHEHRAVLTERNALAGRERLLTELHHVADAGEFPALLGDERAGSRAAGFIHGAIDDPPAGQTGVLRILAADFENRVNPRIVVDGAGGMGGDFVENADRLFSIAIGEQRTDDFAAAARDADGEHGLSASRAVLKPVEQRLGGAHRIPKGVAIILPPEIAGRGIDGDGLRAGGSDVESKD